MMNVRRMSMSEVGLDVVMKVRMVMIVTGLHSLTHHFLAAPPKCSRSLQSLERQNILSNVVRKNK